MTWKSESNSMGKDYFKAKENILPADKIYLKVKLTVGDQKDHY